MDTKTVLYAAGGAVLLYFGWQYMQRQNAPAGGGSSGGGELGFNRPTTSQPSTDVAAIFGSVTEGLRLAGSIYTAEQQRAARTASPYMGTPKPGALSSGTTSTTSLHTTGSSWVPR